MCISETNSTFTVRVHEAGFSYSGFKSFAMSKPLTEEIVNYEHDVPIDGHHC